MSSALVNKETKGEGKEKKGVQLPSGTLVPSTVRHQEDLYKLVDTLVNPTVLAYPKFKSCHLCFTRMQKRPSVRRDRGYERVKQRKESGVWIALKSVILSHLIFSWGVCDIQQW